MAMTKLQVANGVIDCAAGELVAADAILQKWLGSRSLKELLPDFDLSSLPTKVVAQKGLTRICPFDAEPSFATVEQVPLFGKDRNWLLFRIQLAVPAPDREEYRDVVTGLPDRRALEAHRTQWRSDAAGGGKVAHALLFLDLDNFKPVNDQLGHAIGDRVLAELAARWRKSLRSRDLIVRYGGDEFVVLLAGVRSLNDAQPILERLRRVTSDPIRIENHTLEMRASIGVALADDVTVPLEELLVVADRAMYAAKRSSP
jgi:diguanylate cyclase (GGDEF)-like protein